MSATFSVLVVSAGSGKRFGKKKQFCELGGIPLFFHSYLAFQNFPEVKEIIFVINSEDESIYQSWFDRLALSYPQRLVYSFTVGGAERYLSVRNGLDKCKQPFVFIHDAARPLIRKSDLNKLFTSLVRRGNNMGVVPFLPVTDTIKVIDKSGRVSQNLKRDSLGAVSTPQGFELSKFIEANEEFVTRFESSDVIPTDDVEVFMTVGGVNAIKLDYPNPKITYEYDLELAESIYIENSIAKERAKKRAKK